MKIKISDNYKNNLIIVCNKINYFIIRKFIIIDGVKMIIKNYELLQVGQCVEISAHFS